ncbi:hypothetical protein Hanom_Chr11g01040411 [Helianthus anomalus]
MRLETQGGSENFKVEIQVDPAQITQRRKLHLALIITLISALCPRLDVKLPSSWGSHWKQPLYSYGVEVRLSSSYPTQTLP